MTLDQQAVKPAEYWGLQLLGMVGLARSQTDVHGAMHGGGGVCQTAAVWAKTNSDHIPCDQLLLVWF